MKIIIKKVITHNHPKNDITLNVESLIKKMKMTAPTDKQKELSDKTTEVLLNNLVKITKQKNLNDAKNLLQALADKANEAIKAIEQGKPKNEICDLAVEDIDTLTTQIASAVLGDCSSVVNPNTNIEV